jgi:4-hydroxy-tetrahydrodipicolinate reductase
MGERVRAALAGETGLRLAAAVEAPGHPRIGEKLEGGVILSDEVDAALAGCAVAITFAVPAASLALVRAAARARIACVVGTTGLEPAARREIEELARAIPIVLAPNFSVSVSVLAHLVREAARRLGPDFDAEILEIHHAAKRDAPSGTALRLAEAVAEGRGHTSERRLVMARAGDVGPRPPGAIGIAALRGGDNPGEHTVMFVGRGERLELVHRASTRDHFAAGSVRAARWVIGRAPGLYTVEDVLGLGDLPAVP